MDQMVDQSGTRGGTTTDATLVRKVHPMVWKWPKNDQFWAKRLAKVERMVDHSGTHVGGLV